MKVKVELEKVIQVRQYEPLRVAISVEDDVDGMDSVKDLYKEASSKLKSMLIHEWEKYDDLSSRTVPAKDTPQREGGVPRIKKVKSKVVKAEY